MRNFFDLSLLGPTAILFLLGASIIYSISPSLLLSHLIFVLVGIAGFIFVTFAGTRIFFVFSKHLYIGSLLFLMLPYLVGELTRGTFRWIPLGPVNIQPSELVKPLLAICFARFFSTRAFNRPSEYFWATTMVALPVLIIFFQPDLGSALVLVFGWLIALFISGVPLKILAIGGAIVLTAFPLAVKSLKPYQQNRIISFLNPGADPLGSGYNVIQAIVAVGSGQILGKGLGQGTQSHLRFLPENHTDFIFASLAEELGLIGSLILLGSFIALFTRIFQIARKAGSNFESTLVLTLLGMLFFQAFVNIGMNMGILPVTGVPLPLVSYGGSSLISTFFMLGIINSISIREKSKETITIR